MMKPEELLQALKDAGYRDAEFLLVTKDRVDLLLTGTTDRTKDEKNPNGHPRFDMPRDVATRKHKGVVVLRMNRIAFASIMEMPPHLRLCDVKIDIGQAVLAPDAPVVDEVELDPAADDAKKA